MKKLIIIALLAVGLAACGHHGIHGGHHASTANTTTTTVS